MFIITANKELYIALQTKLNDLTKKYDEKVIFKMTAVCASALILASCGGSKNMLTLSSLNGEWNITEVDGQKITDKKRLLLALM